MFPRRNCAPLMAKRATGGGKHFKQKCLKYRSTNQRAKPRHQRRVYKVYEHDDCNDAVGSGDAWVYSTTARKRSADANCRMFVNAELVVFQIGTRATVNMLPARYARDMVPYKGVLTMWNKTVIQP